MRGSRVSHNFNSHILLSAASDSQESIRGSWLILPLITVEEETESDPDNRRRQHRVLCLTDGFLRPEVVRVSGGGTLWVVLALQALLRHRS